LAGEVPHLPRPHQGDGRLPQHGDHATIGQAEARATPTS
jgi:hypothetical protein